MITAHLSKDKRARALIAEVITFKIFTVYIKNKMLSSLEEGRIKQRGARDTDGTPGHMCNGKWGAAICVLWDPKLQFGIRLLSQLI